MSFCYSKVNVLNVNRLSDRLKNEYVTLSRCGTGCVEAVMMGHSWTSFINILLKELDGGRWRDGASWLHFSSCPTDGGLRPASVNLTLNAIEFFQLLSIDVRSCDPGSLLCKCLQVIGVKTKQKTSLNNDGNAIIVSFKTRSQLILCYGLSWKHEGLGNVRGGFSHSTLNLSHLWTGYSCWSDCIINYRANHTNPNRRSKWKTS